MILLRPGERPSFDYLGEGCDLKYNIYDERDGLVDTSEPNDAKQDESEGTAFVGVPLSEIFVSQNGGSYRVVVSCGQSRESQTVSVEYSPINFRSPKPRSFRTINGYLIKTVRVGDHSFVTFEKGGNLRAFAGNGFLGIGDYNLDIESARLLMKTQDSTGDGIPDVIISEHEGGTSCCLNYYFYNLAESVQFVDSIGLGFGSARPTVRQAQSGLRFVVALGYENFLSRGYEESNPKLVFHFSRGRLKLDLHAMRQSPLNISVIRERAYSVRNAFSNVEYKGDPDELFLRGMKGRAFWGEVLDFIFSGNEELGWQYLNLVWPPNKKGKEKMVSELREEISRSLYSQLLKRGH